MSNSALKADGAAKSTKMKWLDKVSWVVIVLCGLLVAAVWGSNQLAQEIECTEALSGNSPGLPCYPTR